jgi:hypothetical protein
MKNDFPDPTPITRHFDGAMRNAALVAALELGICGHLSHGPATVAELAARAGVSLRGAQALLDALVALGIVTVAAGVYANGEAAETYLVPGRPGYVGDEQVGLFHAQLPLWGRMAEAARAGAPVDGDDSPQRMAFWSLLTPSIGRIGRPIAESAVRLVGLTLGAPRLLDVGGGAATWSLALLGLNRRAQATQLDWPHINAAAREAVAQAGHAARFRTVDGNYREAALGEGLYDVAVLSYVVHLESPASTLDLLRRVRAALVPGGRVLVSEMVVDDGRAGPPQGLLFNLNMLLLSESGKSYERGELAQLLAGAGFGEPAFTVLGPWATLAVAERT